MVVLDSLDNPVEEILVNLVLCLNALQGLHLFLKLGFGRVLVSNNR